MTMPQEHSRQDEPAARGRHPELERLISNAVCDEGFAAALLADPVVALARTGYDTRLSRLEQHLVESVRGAQSLAEFAAQLHQRLHPALGRPGASWAEGA